MENQMRTRQWAWGIGLAGLALVSCDRIDTKGSARELKTPKDKISYAIGLDIGRSFKQQSLESKDLDMVKLRTGIEDILNGTKPMLADKELSEIMMVFQHQMMAKHDSLSKQKGVENLKAGEAFMAKNAKEPGVQSLPDGLQYIVLTNAKDGKKPDSNSTVTVHYRGTLLDGTEFDSSIGRGQPATFPLKGVIKGWTEALSMMTTGSKWKIFIPPSLGYGQAGAGDRIGPNATLIFEVELISVTP